MARHKGEAPGVTIFLQDFIKDVADPADLELYHEFSGRRAATWRLLTPDSLRALNVTAFMIHLPFQISLNCGFQSI